MYNVGRDRSEDMYRVLIVDDEPWALVVTRKVFNWEQNGFEIIAETTSPKKAMDIICKQQPDVVFTDIRMPNIDGIELIKAIRQKEIDTEFIIVSGFAEFSYAQEAIRNGALDYCLKPMDPAKSDELLKKVYSHLENKRSLRNNEVLEALMSNSGQSSVLLEKQIIKMNGTVLRDYEANSSFTELVNYICENYHRELYLKDLAAKFYINQFYCCELFRKFLGKTFSDFIAGLRTEKACELMKCKALSIEKVAEMVGYNDYYYFNKVFKKYYGTSPAKYRKIHMQSQ